MKKFFVALLLLSTTAWAQVESRALATWQGELAYQDSEGYTTTCMTTNKFSLQDKYLVMEQSLSGDCDWEMAMGLELQGSEIWQNGVKVGEVTADAISFEGLQVEEGLFYSASLTVDNAEGTHAVFADKTEYAEENYSDSLAGEMIKTPEPLLAKNAREGQNFRSHHRRVMH